MSEVASDIQSRAGHCVRNGGPVVAYGPGLQAGTGTTTKRHRTAGGERLDASGLETGGTPARERTGMPPGFGLLNAAAVSAG
ncbi:hypothetical protein AB0L59_23410 [Streptomyces sp. NPDC052109]|uniref:hypothetical protein n=1 Tax=Streptomyces sp. NPDC052109 TaxID=3155527 RepID=UPI003417BF8D